MHPMRAATTRDLLDRAHRTALNLDQEPWSPHQLGRRWSLHIWDRRRREAAERSPIWKRRESQCVNPDGSYTFVGNGLDVDDFTDHLAHLDALSPEPRYSRLANGLERLRLSRLSRLALCTYDKLTCGWTRADISSLDLHLASTLGAQLIELSRVSHGWPSPQFATHEEWVQALYAHGSALLAYAHKEGLDALYGEWDSARDDVAQAAASAKIAALETELTRQAAEALRWVADHLDHLWD